MPAQPLAGAVSIATLTDTVSEFIDEQGLGAVDTVGSSMGARMVLELARRGRGGNTVALDPSGFWNNAELRFFSVSLRVSIALIRALRPALGALTANPVTRTALLAQFSARPWALSQDVVLRELRSYLAAPSFDAALHSLVHGPGSKGHLPGPRQAGS